MITLSESLGWLNQFSKSHLNSINQQLLAIAKNPLTASEAVRDLIKAVLSQAQSSASDRLDYAETLLNCAAIEYERGWSEPAKAHLSNAIRPYVDAKDAHAVAIASWMIGIIELSLLRTDSSYLNWDGAIKTFEFLRLRHKQIPNSYDWYTVAMGKMHQDLVTLPHESFWWLNRFAPTRLSDLNQKFVDGINENILRKKFDRAYQIIKALKEVTDDCPDVFEVPEIYVETGFAAYRMGNPLQAIKDIKLAVVRYPAGSHRRGATHWMLGAIQWGCEDEKVEAVRNWKKSLDCFSALAKQAERDKLDEPKCWYQEKISHMQQALLGMIAENYS